MNLLTRKSVRLSAKPQVVKDFGGELRDKSMHKAVLELLTREMAHAPRRGDELRSLCGLTTPTLNLEERFKDFSPVLECNEATFEWAFADVGYNWGGKHGLYFRHDQNMYDWLEQPDVVNRLHQAGPFLMDGDVIRLAPWEQFNSE